MKQIKSKISGESKHDTYVLDWNSYTREDKVAFMRKHKIPTEEEAKKYFEKLYGK